MTEVYAARVWMVAQLKADATLNAAFGSKIFWTQAPQGADDPYLIIAPSGPNSDVRVVGGMRIWENIDLMVKLVYIRAEVTSAQADAWLELINAQLDEQEGMVGDYRIGSCVRDGEIPTYTDDQQFQHAGHRYQLIVETPA